MKSLAQIRRGVYPQPIEELIRIAGLIDHRLDIERSERVSVASDTYCCGAYHRELKTILASLAA